MPLKTTTCKKSYFTSSRGFTLIEVMIVIAMITIALAFATPSIKEWRDKGRLTAAVRDLVSNLQLAKMEAAKRNTMCTLTFDEPIGGVTYDYIVYEDADGDFRYDALPAPGEEILNRVPYSNYEPGGAWNRIPTYSNNPAGRPTVAFNSRGLPFDSVGGLSGGSIAITNNRGDTKTVNVSAAGHINIQ